jgi:diguanylate cyclase (GGDEF)-like protein
LIDAGKSIYYLGWFFFLSSIWLLTESNLSQLFISNPLVISALCYLSLLTFPLPLLFHISELEGYHFKIINRAQIDLMLACDIIFILLQFFNIIDFHESLIPYRIILLTVFAVSMITLWISLIKYKEKNLRIITYAITLLFIFSLLEFINYELQFFSETGIFFRVGLYLFMFTLIVDGVKKAIDVIKLSETASRYKLLATRDPLTNCRSRSKYMSDMEKIDLSKNITIFMADMINMKEVNDTLGHHAGDEVVILCSQCLMKVFGHRVYRIGGDEFLCIEYDLTFNDIKHRLAAFTMESDRINAEGPYLVDVSIGYATYDQELDSSIYDTVNRADAMMYQIKEKLKELRSVHF